MQRKDFKNLELNALTWISSFIPFFTIQSLTSWKRIIVPWNVNGNHWTLFVFDSNRKLIEHFCSLGANPKLHDLSLITKCLEVSFIRIIQKNFHFYVRDDVFISKTSEIGREISIHQEFDHFKATILIAAFTQSRWCKHYILIRWLILKITNPDALTTEIKFVSIFLIFTILWINHWCNKFHIQLFLLVNIFKQVEICGILWTVSVKWSLLVKFDRFLDLKGQISINK